MAFGSIYNSYQPKLYDFGAAFVKTAQLAARPRFELQFYNTQSAQLDALDKDIADIQANSNTTSATALLRSKVSGLERSLVDIGDFKDRTDARIAKIGIVLVQLNDLNTLADPGSVAAFDTKLAEAIDTIDKIEARPYEYYGTSDRVRAHKADALSRLQALVHNNFATQPDIDAVTAELATIRNNFLASQQIAGTNASLAFTKYSSTSSSLVQINSEISAISIEANIEAVKKIEERKEYYARVLSVISLAFEASQNLTNFVANEINFEKKTDPGSVLNLFT